MPVEPAALAVRAAIVGLVASTAVVATVALLEAVVTASDGPASNTSATPSLPPQMQVLEELAGEAAPVVPAVAEALAVRAVPAAVGVPAVRAEPQLILACWTNGRSKKNNGCGTTFAGVAAMVVRAVWAATAVQAEFPMAAALPAPAVEVERAVALAMADRPLRLRYLLRNPRGAALVE